MKNFLLFLRAVTRNATYLFTSSVLAAIGTLVEHFRGSSIAARWFLAITVLLLVWSVFKTWLDEHQKVAARDSELLAVRKELEEEKAKKPGEEAQARLLDAQREEIEVRRKARQAEEAHEERMRFLTAPDSGIRLLVREENRGKQQNRVYLPEALASALAAPQSEIEEALRILKSQGFANETRFQGHWFIQG